MLCAHPEAVFETAKQLGNHYHIACEQVRALSSANSAPKKLAAFLLQWTSSDGTPQKQSRTKFTLTHEEIGQIIGTSRETVTRTLSDLKNQQLVILSKSDLVICNRATLAHFAGVEDYYCG